MDRSCDGIRPDYEFNETCQGSCPEAIIAFLDSTNFEDAIRLAVSLGGDSDTIGAMTGGIAAAYYGVPDKIALTALGYLPEEMVEVRLIESIIPPTCFTLYSHYCRCGGYGEAMLALCYTDA